MTHTYRSLVPQLHSTADAAINWFQKQWGINIGAIKIESAISPEIDFCPTFSVTTRDHAILCVEVRENCYSSTIDSVVLQCQGAGIPVLLFVAVPKGTIGKSTAESVRNAKRSGVGILEVDENGGTVIHGPLSLSLTGLHPIDKPSFPAKHRQQLAKAEQTFRDGNPAKACAEVYDELESLFRKFAAKMAAKGFWNNGGIRIAKDPWATIITHLDKNLDRVGCDCPDLTGPLMARILGITPHRNESGHKPTSTRQLIKRDRELRTRFESAVDLLHEFAIAIRKYRV